jgi:hypothetical protein
MRTDAELKKLVIDAVEGKLFGSWMLDANADPLQTFIVLGFMGQDDINNLAERGAFHFFEYTERAMPLGVNGLPMFMSCHYITRDEWPKFCEFHNQVIDMRRSFLGT